MELNSLINTALEQAQRRRAAAAGLSDNLLSTQGVKQAVDQGYSEINVEDIANAMKSRKEVKSNDNLFIERHINDGKVKKDDDKQDSNPSLSTKSSSVEKAQNKIVEAHVHAEHLLDRKAEIFSSLKSVQNNPFCK